MTALIDPLWLQQALAPLKVAGVVNDIRVLGESQRAGVGLMIARTPGIAIVPSASVVTGPQGLGNGRMLTETVELVVQVQQLVSDDQSALVAVKAIREAMLTALERHRPAAGWSPLRYQGGRLLTIQDTIYTWVDRYSTQAPMPTL